MRIAPLIPLVALIGLAACSTTQPPEAKPFGERVDRDSDTFLVIGDSRRGFTAVEWGTEPSDEERIEYAERLRDEKPAFVVHVGDIARTGSDPEDWQDFEDDFEPLREARVAMYPALGNHEYRGPDDTALDLYFARFPRLGRRNHYVREYRGVQLIVLDSNVDELGEPRAERQLGWLRKRLDEAHEDDAIRAVIVVAHHPPFSNRKRPGESDWTRDEVVPLAAQYPKARALFAGHVHSYERFVVAGIHCVVTGGAGSPLHDLKDADDEDARPDLYRGPRGFHYCRVRIGEQITVEVVMRGDDGRWFVADAFEI